MKTTHTPGPWKVNGFSIYTENKVAHWLKPHNPAQCAVAFCYARGGDDDSGEVSENVPSAEEAEANTRLIASAPELLALAKRIEWLAAAGTERNGVPYEISMGNWSRLWEQARAVIAKATGGVG